MNALHSQVEAVLAQLNRVILGKDVPWLMIGQPNFALPVNMRRW